MCEKHYYKLKKYGDPGAGYEWEPTAASIGTKAYIKECVDVQAGPLIGSPCWVWKRSKNKQTGYGACVGPKPKQQNTAHRLSYELYYGEIPSGLHVCHRCDNPPCCNPAHLFLGTVRDNMQDMIAKGRANHEGKHPNPAGRKLSESQVKEIKIKILSGKQTLISIAKEYNINISSIKRIKKGESWENITI